jgi:hypothetical protein
MIIEMKEMVHLGLHHHGYGGGFSFLVEANSVILLKKGRSTYVYSIEGFQIYYAFQSSPGNANTVYLG